ncbi:hypothetical protein PRUPE_6G290600 [Prunus persica]|uniref:Uncharacterized protein n=1 Tax=Prunus persica TaxID=3760 RepID=M5WRZ4_PRUPE|nr:stress response protein NST1 isoform X1 [Prunus persica]XP_020421188.1 stress response protein NST1 isoform X1 [Prunus persica]ONI03912.1 hypothetical protein PRUPE_6G290600 [Prunus persica]
MCILCVIQKWSRRVATMLPWLVIPLIGLWALSQLLPPAFRFEITSPRLACVFVLLVTLFWYEILMPQLSAWRVRRNARLRERKRFEAIELQKLRKTATRRCRNCLTPYRDQNPGGGRFMCSYCGHISKRPVLDLPVLPGMGLSNSGIIKELVGKGGKILNGKVWSENGWMCGQDWLENGNWVSGSIAGKSSYWRKDGSSFFGGDENCLAEKSYSGVVIFACKLLTSFFLSVRWLWRKVFRISTSGEDDASDEHKGMLAKRGENGTNLNESRGEKARRKAEEKRQARIEKELLEEEERKQREEVARLVEERRRLRDEKKEAERDRGKTSPPAREKDNKKEAEKKRQERRKEKDKGSSKSNSDVEELEKKAGKESERKRDFDKKSDIDRREHLKSGVDFLKGQSTETAQSIKNASATNFDRGNAGSRYLDRMRGTIFNSSKAFSGGSFFGKGANTTVTKETKSSISADQVHSHAHKRDLCPPDRIAVRPLMNGDDKSIHRPVNSEPQPGTAPKKSWQQLFTRSSSVPSSSSANVISRPNSMFQTEVQSPQLSGQSSSMQSFDNPINFGLPSPFTLSTTYPKESSTSLGFSPAIEPMFPRIGEGHHELIPEEPELFEDPCYVPDPVSLLGPVSESLDNFQLDMGAGFVKDMGLERPRTLKNGSASSEVNKPSPIESPMSREKHNNSNRFPSTPKAQDMHALPLDDANANDKGTWQMWNSCPLGQEGLGFAGGPPSWLLPPELNRSNKDDLMHPSSQKPMVSLFATEDQGISGSHSPQSRSIFLGNGQNGGAFSPVTGSSDHDPWSQKAFFPPLSTAENHYPLKPPDETTKNDLIFGSPRRSTTNHPFEMSPANCWSKKEWDECVAVQGTGEGVGKPSALRPHIRGLYPTPDVQSLW